MKVSTLVTQSVELDERAVETVFNTRLAELCGGDGVYINDGWLEEWEDTGHGSGLTHQKGRATELQKAAIHLRDLLVKKVGGKR